MIAECNHDRLLMPSADFKGKYFCRGCEKRFDLVEWLPKKDLCKWRECCCGEPSTKGVVHRKDGPCYWKRPDCKCFCHVSGRCRTDGRGCEDCGCVPEKPKSIDVVKELTEEDTKILHNFTINKSGLSVCCKCGVIEVSPMWPRYCDERLMKKETKDGETEFLKFEKEKLGAELEFEREKVRSMLAIIETFKKVSGHTDAKTFYSHDERLTERRIIMEFFIELCSILQNSKKP